MLLEKNVYVAPCNESFLYKNLHEWPTRRYMFRMHLYDWVYLMTAISITWATEAENEVPGPTCPRHFNWLNSSLPKVIWSGLPSIYWTHKHFTETNIWKDNDDLCLKIDKTVTHVIWKTEKLILTVVNYIWAYRINFS